MPSSSSSSSLLLSSEKGITEKRFALRFVTFTEIVLPREKDVKRSAVEGEGNPLEARDWQLGVEGPFQQ